MHRPPTNQQTGTAGATPPGAARSQRLAAAAASLAFVVGATVMAAALAASDAPQQTGQPTAASPAGRSPLVASATCSNANCHGGRIEQDAAPEDAWRHAYTTWASLDPHADAYTVLHRDPSRRMVANLTGGKQLDDEAYRQVLADRCIACHATVAHSPPDADASLPRDPPLTAGVTCAACHGDAASWLDDHLLASSPEKSHAQISGVSQLNWRTTNPDYGLMAMDDEVTRARTCVACHVGSSGKEDGVRREVNHDLIAAGHPRLAFEYTSHLANLPPHWRPAESTAPPAFAWTAGQLVAAEAASSLLVARCELAAPASESVWPEFSEYACASCHHHLRDADKRTVEQVRRAAHGGLYHWGSWYYQPVAQALESLQSRDAGSPSQTLSQLRKAMKPLVPDKKTVAPAALKLQQQLRRAIIGITQPGAAQRINPPRFNRQTENDDNHPFDWDYAAQAYLWHAHRMAQTETDTAQETESLNSLFLSLEPADKINSPLWLHYQPHTISESLNTLQPSE